MVVATAAEARDALRTTLLTARRTAFAELLVAWRALDTKAQGSVAISGIFVAGAFGFIRDWKDVQWYDRSLMGATLVCLVISVIAAVAALRVTSLPTAPWIPVAEMASAILDRSTEADLPERGDVFLYDEALLWETAASHLTLACKRKARWLQLAQFFLVLGIGTAAVLTFWRAVSL